MEEELQNFFTSFLIAFVSLCYAYLVPSKLPIGMLRVLSLLPIFSLFIILPLSLSRPIPIIIISWFFSWLANFKLLLYCFNIGPLTTQNSFTMFILVAALPIKLKAQKDPPICSTRPEKIIKRDFKLTMSIFSLFIYIYERTKSWVMFGFLLFLLIDISFMICAFLISPLGLDLEEPSDEPYVSSSLQDFWGRRWNRMASDALRNTVYFPIRRFLSNYLGRKWAQVIGTMASFIVSGLIHELMFYYVIRAEPTWEVTCYFVLQGLCVVLEVFVKKDLGWKLNLHWAVSGPLTVAFVKTTGYWLFYPPLYRNHICEKVIEDVKAFCKFFIPI